MRIAIPIVLLCALALGCWKVYAIRARLGREDADPQLVEQVRQRLQLPLEIKGTDYVGERYEIDEDVVREAGADVFGSVIYRDAAERTFRIYIGGSIGNQENFHAPSYCLPAAGWEVQSHRVVPLMTENGALDEATMRRMSLQLGRSQMLVYYWFQAGERKANHEWTIRWYRFLDLLVDKPLRPTMIVTVYVPVVDSVAETEERAMEFLRTLAPHINRALAPQEPTQ